MTHEQFIELETARLARKAGFDWRTYPHYQDIYGDKLLEAGLSGNWNYYKDCYSAPTQSVLQRWLRETKNIHIQIMFDSSITVNKYYVIIKTKDTYSNSSIKDIYHNFLMRDNHISYFDTFEAALEAAEQKCLTLIIEKQ